MKKWKPWLALALVFVAGLVVGVVGTRLATRRFIRIAIQHPEMVSDRIEHELVRKLRLDPGQQQKIHATLEDSQRQLRDLRKDFQPRFVDIMSSAQTRIAEVLTPEQRVKFERLQEENRRIFPPLPKR